MRNLKKNTHTLTEGSIWKGILLFALPLLGSSLIQQLYSTVDLIFVGQLLGTKASAAIGASGLIVTCLIGFFNGMAVGTNVFAARHYGAKRFNELKKLIQTIFWTGIIGGLLLMVIGLNLKINQITEYALFKQVMLDLDFSRVGKTKVAI